MHKVSLKDAQKLTGQFRHWAYNALDCVGTLEIANVLLPRLNKQQRRFYAFERASQLPAFAMSRRGILVDQEKRRTNVKLLRTEVKAKIKEINLMSELLVLWDAMKLVTGQCKKSTRKDGRHTWKRGVPDSISRKCENCKAKRMTRAAFNPNSSKQCIHLFYDLMKLKPMRNKKGEISTDEECLQRLGRKYKKAFPLTEEILVVRGLKKQIGFLSCRLSPEGRFTSTFTVGQAWTGRWSAAKSPHKEGGNAQNISERHRDCFIADPGYELCYADLKQAESNIVAHLAGDEEYIRAHKEGDVHTYVTRLVWSELEWTGDLKEDKVVAKQNPKWDLAPGHNFRFQAKRIQHGGNFGLTPYGIARIAHIPVSAAESAAAAYHRAFPGIRVWQRATAETVHQRGALSFPLGFTVKLFGRPWDDHTVKQGLALIPQGTVAHIINIAAWRLLEMDCAKEIQLLAQVHDAVLFQYPKGRLDIVKKAVELMTIPLKVTDTEGHARFTTIEVEVAVGANWGHYNDDPERGKINLEGLQEIDV